MEKVVYIVCGGTGGHLAPGIATAQRLIDAGVPVELIISEKEVDSRLMKAHSDIPFRKARGRAFSWQPYNLVLFFLCTVVCTFRSWRMLRGTQPGLVVAFGGFMSLSFVLSAWFLDIPVILHEANRKPGKSIRFLSRMAEMVFLPEGVSLRGIEARRMKHLGMPLRKEIQHIPKEAIRRKLGVPASVKVLVVAGGSQGAQVLNDWVKRLRKAFAVDDIWIYLVAGPGKNELPPLETFTSNAGNKVEVRTFAFHNSLNELFSCADVVVSRAGAGTLAELVACLAPSILVPFPYAADDHQTANARYLEQRGGCVLLPQEKLDHLYREVMDLIYNDWLLGQIRSNLRRLSMEDAAGELSDYILRRIGFSQPTLDPVSEKKPGKELANEAS